MEIQFTTQLRKELINYLFQEKTIPYSGVFRRALAEKPQEGDVVLDGNINSTSSVCVVCLFKSETPLVTRQSKVPNEALQGFDYSYHFWVRALEEGLE